MLTRWGRCSSPEMRLLSRGRLTSEDLAVTRPSPHFLGRREARGGRAPVSWGTVSTGSNRYGSDHRYFTQVIGNLAKSPVRKRTSFLPHVSTVTASTSAAPPDPTCRTPPHTCVQGAWWATGQGCGGQGCGQGGGGDVESLARQPGAGSSRARPSGGMSPLPVREVFSGALPPRDGALLGCPGGTA
ncbi:hypothetical protein O3P69_000237 [Scylla paramamosain]|uniref:Uncharacterized protein n=1 Tax=Scylla paramamosain TaxID=85552 RepID=A0AAW0UWE2_SCYPA